MGIPLDLIIKISCESDFHAMDMYGWLSIYAVGYSETVISRILWSVAVVGHARLMVPKLLDVQIITISIKNER